MQGDNSGGRVDYDTLKRKFIGSLDSDWSANSTGMLVCPCGKLVEDDGKCPNGHYSPLKRIGGI